MLSKLYEFRGLVADSAGTVTGTRIDSQPIAVILERVVVRSRTGCQNRSHDVTARFSGGVTFNYNGRLVDCQDLEVPLGGLVLAMNTPATISFEVRGYTPGERVDFDGVLHANTLDASIGAGGGGPAAGVIPGTQQPATTGQAATSGAMSGQTGTSAAMSGQVSIPPVAATLITGMSDIITSPMNAFNCMMGGLINQMPVIGASGIFMMMRSDFQNMTNAINRLAEEIKKNNESRRP